MLSETSPVSMEAGSGLQTTRLHTILDFALPLLSSARVLFSPRSYPCCARLPSTREQLRKGLFLLVVRLRSEMRVIRRWRRQSKMKTSSSRGGHYYAWRQIVGNI